MPTADRPDTSSHRLYIGSPERPLGARFHLPRAMAPTRGGVVLCPPLGYEYVCAYRSFVNLGDLLADRGFGVLRFDYEGTGQSGGTLDEPGLLTAWIASVGLAIDELRARVDGPVLSVGLRLGASLTLLDSARCDRVAAVLWDPIVSGRRYVRELSLLAATGAPMEAPLENGTISVAGQIVSTGLAAELASFDLTRSGPYGLSRALLITRTDRPPVSDLEQKLRESGVSIDHQSADGTEGLLDRDAELAVSPRRIFEGIADWLETVAPATQRATSRPAPPMQIGWQWEAEGLTVTEEVARIGRHELAAVIDRPVGQQPKRAVAFFNNGVATSIGPGRSWVDWARRAVLAGCLAVRVEHRGIGDSPSGPGGQQNTSYNATDVEDAQSVIDWALEQGVESISIVGLCSGALLALEVTARPGPVDRAVAINPLMYNFFPVGFDGRRPPPYRRILHWAMTKEKARRVALLAPRFLWSIVDAVGLYPSPGRYARRSVTAGTKVLLVFGHNDKGWFDLRRRGARALRQLEKHSDFAIELIDILDHSMFGLRAREETWKRVGPFLLGQRSDPASSSAVPQPPPAAPSCAEGHGP